MLKKIKHYLQNELNFDFNQKVVLAVSGGMDSMCLWYLMRELGLSYTIAHCNFNLRGSESDADEQLVLDYATKEEKVFTKSFNTADYSKKKKVSIQMAARDLRYSWFDELLVQEHAVKVATAHHLDDQVETFFIQLLRRGSISALSGIPVLTENRIRPLMFANRNMINQFILENNIPYREDSSNSSDKYLRNNLRNNLIPAIDKVDKSLKNKVLELMSELKSLNDFINQYIEEWNAKLSRKNGGDVYYSISEIQKLEFSELFIEKIMQKHGFNKRNVEMVLESLDAQSGKVFYGQFKKLIKDRDQLIFTPIEKADKVQHSLYKSELADFSSLPFRFSISGFTSESEIRTSKEITQLDYDKLNEHLIFRKWKDGDSFIPLGMKGSRKLSDYFIDKKYSLLDKSNQWLVISGDEICCLIGERIDERYKITNETSTVLTISVSK